MERFCILTIDQTGHVLDVDEFEAANDQAAIERALESSACRIGFGYEIWQDNRQVCVHFRSRLSRC